MRDHTKLRAFELADDLVISIYHVTRKFPKYEVYGLTSQMRRAAVSVPSNIVEGCTRESQAEYLRFLEIAFGSLWELNYQYGLSKRLGYTTESPSPKVYDKMIEAQKVLGSLIRSMRKSKNTRFNTQ